MLILQDTISNWFNIESPLKKRWYSHKISSETCKYKNSTTLSKYLWDINDKIEKIYRKTDISPEHNRYLKTNKNKIKNKQQNMG